MAKAGEFKNKITKAQEELFKALENEQTKRNTIYNISNKYAAMLSNLNIDLIKIPKHYRL